MKLLRFDNWATGLLLEGATGFAVIDVASSLSRSLTLDGGPSERLRPFFEGSGGANWQGLITSWSSLRGPLAELLELGQSGDSRVVVKDLSTVVLRPALVHRYARIFGGGSMPEHSSVVETWRQGREISAEEVFGARKRGKVPKGINYLADSVVASGENVTPPVGTQKLDYEAEIGVVFENGGRRLEPEEFRIWGFTGWNDFSIRDPHFGIGPAIDGSAFPGKGGMGLGLGLQKNFETGKSCGPWMTVDEPYDVGSIGIRCRVNGELRQDGSTRGMSFTFAEVASHYSDYFTIQPGDMITSGTPRGTAFEGGENGPYLKDGDVVEVEIEGVGVLRNCIAIAV
jgi:2-keto-4-pentenoate hydratase/2-oxohepta-3-ene-1,7-dioic acid hydratase in catechol pathway